MAAALFRESLQVQPAVRAKAANKDLKQKNNRALHNWQKVRNVLDREKEKWAKGVQDDRNKLLKHREMLRNTSLNLTRSDSLHSEDDATPQVKPRLSLKDVYDTLLKSAQEQEDGGFDSKSVKSEPPIMSSTVSSEQKRVGRKAITFSLQGLQKANSNLQSKLQAMEKAQQRDLAVDDENHNARPVSGPPPSHFDLNDEERSLGPTLKLPPTRLPPIARSVSFKPQARSFNKDEEFKKRVKGREYSLDDIRYCRYLRKRALSDPIEPTKKLPHHHRSTTSSKPQGKK
ncbi:uncharacterized protein LOC110058966 [Orbicella faveolata]|uniref:uncharacterized protein LOC110058966 n=1 Tax=Orbicella faveolata TaxID=48498 RepID=UPI0009E3B599|nr:uncharacterized protein LOC110058966 [Orbicella faveolata]